MILTQAQLQKIINRVLLATYEYYKNSLSYNAQSYVIVPYVDYVEIITKKLKKGDYLK